MLRFAILLIALWQAGTALVPHSGSFSGASSARAHLHGTGDQLEFAHDETACPACTHHQVASWANAPARPIVEFVHRYRPYFTSDDQPASTNDVVVLFSRGPPSLV